MEMTGANSPRPALTALQAYLASNLEPALLPAMAGAIDTLAGADERWSNAAAILDPSRSVGASDEANKLRLLADDLAAVLIAESPRLISLTSRDEWWGAYLPPRTAARLLCSPAPSAGGSPLPVGRV